MTAKHILDVIRMGATALAAIVPIIAIYAPGRTGPAMFLLVLFFVLAIALRKAFEAQVLASIAFLVCAFQSARLLQECDTDK